MRERLVETAREKGILVSFDQTSAASFQRCGRTARLLGGAHADVVAPH
ncbi:MAG: hypothetical protein ACLRZH_05755 [Ruthenibacterium lactatiformans]